DVIARLALDTGATMTMMIESRMLSARRWPEEPSRTANAAAALLNQITGKGSVSYHFLPLLDRRPRPEWRSFRRFSSIFGGGKDSSRSNNSPAVCAGCRIRPKCSTITSEKLSPGCLCCFRRLCAFELMLIVVVVEAMHGP